MGTSLKDAFKKATKEKIEKIKKEDKKPNVILYANKRHKKLEKLIGKHNLREFS